MELHLDTSTMNTFGILNLKTVVQVRDLPHFSLIVQGYNPKLKFIEVMFNNCA